MQATNTQREKRIARRKAEMSRGKKQIKIAMATALIEEVQKSLDVGQKFRFHLIFDHDDPRQWGVRVDFNNGQAHAENWWDFPTDELKTKIMLFGGVGKVNNAYARK